MEMLSHISPPKSALEVIANIKLILDKEFLLRPEFYTENNFRRCLGGKEIHFRRFKYKESALSLVFEGHPLSSLAMDVKEEYKEGKLTGGRIRVDNSSDSDELSLQALQQLFDSKPYSLSSFVEGDKNLHIERLPGVSYNAESKDSWTRVNFIFSHEHILRMSSFETYLK